eukprot:gb/GECH01000104.1/.p1 GENE.gb/GECH01000104.1/~~gb/GECH01000104.1/.p1  ORF type:complete len:367 (+),score=61.91 gb/GECH01000104.1/:1-1101(+)
METWIVIFVAIIAAMFLHVILFFALKFVTARTTNKIDDDVVLYSRWPALPVFIALAFLFVLPGLDAIGDTARDRWRHGLGICLIIFVGWWAICIVMAIERAMLRPYWASALSSPEGDLSERQVHTQVYILRRIAIFLIILVDIGAVLMTFEQVRDLGTSLLTFSGLAGIVAGYAAAPVLENLLASVQIAITQPMCINDVVNIDGEFGHIEDIRATYVVLRTWDERRVVIPLVRIISSSFQNWTHGNHSDLLGIVYICVDYTAPIEVIRKKARKLAERSGMWDGRKLTLVVYDSLDDCMMIRLVISAPNSDIVFDIRHHMREQIISYLQKNYPSALPRRRLEMVPTKGRGSNTPRSQSVSSNMNVLF